MSPLSFANLTYSRPSSFVISPAVAESDSATAAPPLIPRDSAHFDRDAILALLRLAFNETDDRENACVFVVVEKAFAVDRRSAKESIMIDSTGGGRVDNDDCKLQVTIAKN